jgi:hypothetical protein
METVRGMATLAELPAAIATYLATENSRNLDDQMSVFDAALG